MTYQVKSPRKLIEVALPLEAINAACAREKSIRHGHPSTLHLWWARRPLAAARAVIFAQLVNDPGFQHGAGFRYGKNKKEAAAERQRLFTILENLVKWESTADPEVLQSAQAEIRRSWREVCELNKDHPQASELFRPDAPPSLHDPFAGGGAIPLEAQRLGIEAFASDLNPVAVLINKAMVEIPPRFANRPPVHPDARRRASLTTWTGAQGLADDLRHYGQWMRAEAESRIGHLYPRIRIDNQLARERPDLASKKGQDLTVIAWLWARTIKSPNPAYAHIHVPLVSNFVLASKPGKERWIEVVTSADGYRFEIRSGEPPDGASDGTKLGRGANFRCVMSNTAIEPSHIYSEARAGRMGARLMAIVAEGDRERVYLPPLTDAETLAASAEPSWRPEVKMPENPRWFSPPGYGLVTYGDIFTNRQLVTLSTLSDLVGSVRERVLRDAVASGIPDDGKPLESGGAAATAYADAVATYVGIAVSRFANPSSALCSWNPGKSKEDIRYTFSRQALPMTWDFAEGNPFSNSSGNFADAFDTWLAKSVELLPASVSGHASQQDAQTQSVSQDKIVSTDPPYYDNIGYADLSDFFYVWLRRSLREIYPGLFTTMAVPKAEELVATPYRHGSKERAEEFFLSGMTAAMQRLASQAHPAIPVTIYYAFKQSENESDTGASSTGWETFLEAVMQARFAITGTWPMRTERGARSVGIGTNALASSIILVCRKREDDAAQISRREFLRELNAVLPEALDEMTRGVADGGNPVAPVDISQALIGPGMAVFSKYAAVLEADGSRMSVRSALQAINRFLSEDDFDADTQFCLRWFEQARWNADRFGEADKLARAKGTSVEGVRQAGVVESRGGQVRLLKWAEYPQDWDPTTDSRNPVWETLHHLIRVLKTQGESAAGRLLSSVRDKGEPARQLAYRLYTLCERQGWVEDARVYNEIITSWSGIEAAAAAGPTQPVQGKLFD